MVQWIIKQLDTSLQSTVTDSEKRKQQRLSYIDSVDQSRRTALHWASLNSFTAVVDYLMKIGGANPIATDRSGTTAVQFASGFQSAATVTAAAAYAFAPQVQPVTSTASGAHTNPPPLAPAVVAPKSTPLTALTGEKPQTIGKMWKLSGSSSSSKNPWAALEPITQIGGGNILELNQTDSKMIDGTKSSGGSGQHKQPSKSVSPYNTAFPLSKSALPLPPAPPKPAPQPTGPDNPPTPHLETAAAMDSTPTVALAPKLIDRLISGGSAASASASRRRGGGGGAPHRSNGSTAMRIGGGESSDDEQDVSRSAMQSDESESGSDIKINPIASAGNGTAFGAAAATTAVPVSSKAAAAGDGEVSSQLYGRAPLDPAIFRAITRQLPRRQNKPAAAASAVSGGDEKMSAARNAPNNLVFAGMRDAESMAAGATASGAAAKKKSAPNPKSNLLSFAADDDLYDADDA